MKLARYIKSMEPSTEPSLMKLAEKSMSTTVISKRNHVFLSGKKQQRRSATATNSTLWTSPEVLKCTKLGEMSRFIDD